MTNNEFLIWLIAKISKDIYLNMYEEKRSRILFQSRLKSSNNTYLLRKNSHLCCIANYILQNTHSLQFDASLHGVCNSVIISPCGLAIAVRETCTSKRTSYEKAFLSVITTSPQCSEHFTINLAKHTMLTFSFSHDENCQKKSSFVSIQRCPIVNTNTLTHSQKISRYQNSFVTHATL